MNPIETANSSISLINWIKNLFVRMFIRVRIVSGQASFRFIETSISKYTEVGVSFHIENKNSYPLTITDFRVFVKSNSGSIYESKAYLKNNVVEPNRMVWKQVQANFMDAKFTNEKEITIVIHLNAKKIKTFKEELIPLEELSQKRKGTISDKSLEKQRKRLKA